MSFLADTHVHLYPEFNLARFFDQAFSNLRALDQEAQRILCLTETANCHAFQDLKQGNLPLPPSYSVEPTTEKNVVKVTQGEETLFLLAGRQIVCRERLEILALGCLNAPEDHLPIREVIPDVEEQGGIPVLAWAPGKWMFKRKAIVEAVATEFKDRVWLGDSRLRCQGWPAPALMKRASRPVFAGSDPLPVPGEEAECGTYGVKGSAVLPEGAVWETLRNAFSDSDLQLTGERNHVVGMFRRLWTHSRSKAS